MPGHRQCDFNRLAIDLISARQRSRRRKLRDDDEITAVELRNKADRRFTKFVQAEGDDTGIDQQHQNTDPHEFRGQPAIAMGKLVEVPIEQTEKAVDRLAPPMAIRDLTVRLEQHRAERRRQASTIQSAR